MANSQFSQQDRIPNAYKLSCEIRFLSESVSAWIKDHAESGISPHNDDAAYGLEIIMSRIASEVELLGTGNSGKGGQVNG